MGCLNQLMMTCLVWWPVQTTLNSLLTRPRFFFIFGVVLEVWNNFLVCYSTDEILSAGNNVQKTPLCYQGRPGIIRSLIGFLDAAASWWRVCLLLILPNVMPDLFSGGVKSYFYFLAFWYLYILIYSRNYPTNATLVSLVLLHTILFSQSTYLVSRNHHQFCASRKNATNACK